MCLPSAPKIDTPPPPQMAKEPDTAMLKSDARRNRSAMTGGSLLTSPTGVANAAASTGRTTLLGG